jgi:hypothetical protein
VPSSQLSTDERAELEALRDLHARYAFTDDAGQNILMPWIDAHHRHEDEPYIGCPFCRDQFIPVSQRGILLGWIESAVEELEAGFAAQWPSGRRPPVHDEGWMHFAQALDHMRDALR